MTKRKKGIILICLVVCAMLNSMACKGKSEQKDAEYFPSMKYSLGFPYTEKYCFYPDDYTYYFDTATGEHTLFCFDSSCEHQKQGLSDVPPTCLALNVSSRTAYLTNQHLYFLHRTAWNTCEYIRAEQTGSNQEVLAVLENVQSVENVIYDGDQTYFCIHNSVDYEQQQLGEVPKVSIICVNRETGEQTVLAEETGCGYGISLMGTYVQDGYLYYVIAYETEQLDWSDLEHIPSGEEIMSVSETDIYRVDLLDGTKTLLLHRQADCIEYLVGTKYYYCESVGDTLSSGKGTTSMHMIDLETMEEYTDERIQYAKYFDSCGENLFVETYHENCFHGYLLNSDGEIIRSVQIPDRVVIAVFENGLYYAYNGPDGGVEAWISMDAFWEGRFEEEKIVQ